MAYVFDAELGVRRAFSSLCKNGISGVDELIDEVSGYYENNVFDSGFRYCLVESLVGDVFVSNLSDFEFCFFHRSRFFSDNDFSDGLLSSHGGWSVFYSNLIAAIENNGDSEILRKIIGFESVIDFESGFSKCKQGQNNTSNDGPCGFLFKERALLANNFNNSEVLGDFLCKFDHPLVDELVKFINENTFPCLVKYFVRPNDPVRIVENAIRTLLDVEIYKREPEDWLLDCIYDAQQNIPRENILSVSRI